MDFHPLAISIVCTLKEKLLFSLKNEEDISHGNISVQMPIMKGAQAITFTEMPGAHYQGIMCGHTSHGRAAHGQCT